MTWMSAFAALAWTPGDWPHWIAPAEPNTLSGRGVSPHAPEQRRATASKHRMNESTTCKARHQWLGNMLLAPHRVMATQLA